MNETVYRAQIKMKAPATEDPHVVTLRDLRALKAADVGAAAVFHEHAVSDVHGLQAVLDSKADGEALGAYALAADVEAGLAQKADAAALAEYATEADLASRLAAKADTAALAAYVTKAESNAALADKADTSALEGYVTEHDMDAELAHKADLVGGVIKAEQMPPGAISKNYTVANEADLTGLTTAVPNDKAEVTSTGEVWLLWAAPPTTAGNWRNLTALGDPVDIGVSSVAGKTGAVTLTPGDIVGLPSALDDKANAADLAPIAGAAQAAYDLAGSKAGTAAATASADGLMSAADKSKLDGISAGAQANVVKSVAGRTGDVTLTKADVGLGNVNNTSDADKPVSTATQQAIAAAIPKIKMFSGTITGNGSAVAFTVTHNLGTKSVNVQTFDASGNWTPFGVQVTSTSAVKLTAAVAPANGAAYTVVIMGIGA